MPRLPALVLAAALLAGCEIFSGESAEKLAAMRESEGKAIGGACRHAGRAIEDCYVLNKRADKAAVFAGWREMNDYMREYKLEALTPQMSGQPVSAGIAAASPSAAASAPPAKSAAGKDSKPAS